MYDCKARFQTKGNKIQKPFLLHTHPLDAKTVGPPPPTLPSVKREINNSLPSLNSSQPASSSTPRNSLPNALSNSLLVSIPRNPAPMNMERPNISRTPTNMTINVKPMDVLKMNDTS